MHIPRLTLLTALLTPLLLLSCNTPASSGPAGEPVVVRGQTPQLTLVPAGWEFRPLTLPAFATIAKAAKPNPYIYGLYTWAGEYRTHHDAIRKVGWRSFRNGGPLDDDAMRLFASDDVEVMPCIGPSNADAKPIPGAADNSAFVDQYAKMLSAFVDRYGPGGTFFKENPAVPNRPIRCIEICNEPNFQYLIPDGPPQNVVEPQREKLYAQLLPAAFNAIKSHNPAVKVVGFGAGGSGAGDMRFIEHVHQDNPAVAKSYDMLSTHPYVEPAPPEAWSIQPWGGYSVATSLATIRATLAKNGRSDAPIWYTECGWPISKADGGRFAMKGAQVAPLIQAACVCRMYAFSMRLGVQRVHIMFATDTDNFNAGFFLPDGTWRPSAHAVQTMIHLMPAPKLLEAITDGANGTFIYRFAPSEAPSAKPVIMAWNVTGPKNVDIPLHARSATLTDMLGHSQRVTPTNGQITLEIGPLPVYLQANE